MSIENNINDSIEVKNKLLEEKYLRLVEDISNKVIEVLKNGNKILIAGNGGSAADAQHFAAELVGRFLYERKSLPAISLTANSSIITAIANDFGADEIFSRQINGLANYGDIFFGISTSGNSKNIIKALEKSKTKGIFTIGLAGKDGGKMKDFCDLLLIVPSNNTPRIQEAHILIIHLICLAVDNAFVEKNLGR